MRYTKNGGQVLAMRCDIFESYWSIAGISVRISSNRQQAFDCLNASFGGFEEIKNGVPEFEIAMVIISDCVLDPGRAPTQVSIDRPRHIVSLAFGPEIRAKIIEKNRGRACGLFAASPEKARAVIPDDFSGDSSVRGIILGLLGSALMGFFRSKGFAVIHSAAVAFCNNAVLLTGSSGSGKSSVSLILASAGYGWLCDDLALIRKRGDGFSCFGLPGMIGVPGICADILPSLRAVIPEGAGDRFKLPAFTVLRSIGANRVSEASPRVIVFPEIREGVRTGIIPVERSLLIRKMIQFDGFFFSETHKLESICILQALAARVEGYELILGGNIREILPIFKGLMQDKAG